MTGPTWKNARQQSIIRQNPVFKLTLVTGIEIREISRKADTMRYGKIDVEIRRHRFTTSKIMFLVEKST